MDERIYYIEMRCVQVVTGTLAECYAYLAHFFSYHGIEKLHELGLMPKQDKNTRH